MRFNKALTFNGINLSDFNCYYDGSESFRIPEKTVSTYSVVGLNGDLVISQDRYSNITLPFNCCINAHFRKNYVGLINFLSTVEGYGRLETTEDPEVYRQAMFNAGAEPNIWQGDKGTFTLSFNCKPQKWLKQGEMGIKIISSSQLYNPTLFNALPLIEVTGTGTITINDTQLVLSKNTSTVKIDCELQDAYEGTINRNSDLTITNGFPKLKPGLNEVSVNGCTINLIPRWWRL